MTELWVNEGANTEQAVVRVARRFGLRRAAADAVFIEDREQAIKQMLPILSRLVDAGIGGFVVNAEELRLVALDVLAAAEGRDT